MRPALAPLLGRRRLAGCMLGFTCWTLAACNPASTEPPHPPPVVYEVPSDFSGKWRGEVDGISGTFQVDRLSDGKYYGYFHARGRSGAKRYILSLVQERARVEAEDALANVCAFTWIDGRGSEGNGWLLINRENTTITGTFGRGAAMSGMGVWTFVRPGVGR